MRFKGPVRVERALPVERTDAEPTDAADAVARAARRRSRDRCVWRARAAPLVAPARMAIDQGAVLGGAAGGTPPAQAPLSSEAEALRASLAAIEAAPPTGKRHLVIIGNGYSKQFTAAVNNAPGVGLHPVHLQSTAGYSAIVPHLVGAEPSDIAEVALIIDDPELHPILLQLVA